MKALLAASFLAALSNTALAQALPDPEPAPAPADPPAPAAPVADASEPCVQPCATPAVAYADQRPAPAPTIELAPAMQQPVDIENGWHKPVGRRFLHGFRLGWTYLYHMDRMRIDDDGMPTVPSLRDKYGLRSPNMMLIGYEGFYRIIGHSWLNVLMVGNVTVAGLEQSKFIPAASGLIGFEFNRSFQLGIGVNITPDPHAPSHMIAAAGWTPNVGSIQTPLHFFFVPDTDGNHRMGATIGMTW